MMMKKLLLFSTVAIFGLLGTAKAQCTPDPIYATEVFGIWPDTIENLPCGFPNTYYETVLDFKLPTEAHQVDSVTYPPGIPINWVRLDSVPGIPAGIGYVTDVSGPQWVGGNQGCATLLGQAAAGTYNLTIWVTGQIVISGFPVEVPLEFGGYILELDPGCVVGLKEVEPTQLTLVNNVPNPFSDETTIRYQLPNSGQLEFIVSDLLGKTVYEEVLSGLKGENKLVFVRYALYPGIYLYQLKHKDQTVTGKMIISGQ
jgi:hypothetical protein